MSFYTQYLNGELSRYDDRRILVGLERVRRDKARLFPFREEQEQILCRDFLDRFEALLVCRGRALVLMGSAGNDLGDILAPLDLSVRALAPELDEVVTSGYTAVPGRGVLIPLAVLALIGLGWVLLLGQQSVVHERMVYAVAGGTGVYIALWASWARWRQQAKHSSVAGGLQRLEEREETLLREIQRMRQRNALLTANF